MAFPKTIKVKEKRVYTATKLPVERTAPNHIEPYTLRIQAYELDEKVDGNDYVFIVQLKYSRNVHSTVNHRTAPLGISLGNHGGFGGNMGGRVRRDMPQQHKSRKRPSKSFFDQIWLQHRSRKLLERTVKIINRTFDHPDFVQYNEHTNQFEFKFEKMKNENKITMIKCVSLPRDCTSKQAKRKLDLRQWTEPKPPHETKVECLNPKKIESSYFDFDIKLTLLPIKYKFFVEELFAGSPTTINARDFIRIKNLYIKKLRDFVRDQQILEKYIAHLKSFEPRYQMREWNKNNCESGPLFELYSILLDIGADYQEFRGENGLFQISVSTNEHIKTSISPQTVADFIALALKHHVNDVVRRRLKRQSKSEAMDHRERGGGGNAHSNSSRKRRGKEGLNDYVLSESDRYILSVILPYFGSPPLKSVHKQVAHEALPSGLFTHFCEELTTPKPKRLPAAASSAEKSSANPPSRVDDSDLDSTWIQKVEPLQLKNRLLEELHREEFDVVQQYYLAKLHCERPTNESDGTHRQTFFVRPQTYSQIYDDNRHYDVDPKSKTLKAKTLCEFQERKVSWRAEPQLIVSVADVSFEFEWAFWWKKKLKQFENSRGSWRCLKSFDPNQRVPVDHLDCILNLLRHKSLNMKQITKLLNEQKSPLSVHVVFLKDPDHDADGNSNSNRNKPGRRDHHNDDNHTKWTENDVEAEYKIKFWNGTKFGNSAISLNLIKTKHSQNVDPKKQKKSVDPKKQYDFVHFRYDSKIEWMWYDNDKARYVQYESKEIQKQLEATYQGVSNEMFPIDLYHREVREKKLRKFNCAALPTLSRYLASSNRNMKPFVLRFTFDKSSNNGHEGGKIINIEQLAINNMMETFPRNVKRVSSGKAGVLINDEEQRVSQLGEMNIYQSDQQIKACWKFDSCPEMGLTSEYHFKAEIPWKDELKFKRMLDYWRNNVLFDQQMKSTQDNNRGDKQMVSTIDIVVSRMWESDSKTHEIRNISDHQNDNALNASAGFSEDGGFHINVDYDMDRKEEEPSSSSNRKRQECIPCDFIKEWRETEFKEEPDAMNRDEEDKEWRMEIRNIDTLHKLCSDNGQFHVVDDSMWGKLDSLDDLYREYVIKSKPEYVADDSAYGNETALWEFWKETHAPHQFRRVLYKSDNSLSLHFVQSILSVMKHHGPKYRKQFSDRPLFVVLSNEKELYKEIAGLHVDRSKEWNTSLSYLFNGDGDVKRINGNERVFTLKLDNFINDIIQKGFLHRFASMTSLKHKETLVLFTRPRSDNLYIAHQGFVGKLSLEPHDQDLHYFLPLFVPLKVGDCVDIQAFSTPDRGTIVGLWRKGTTIRYRIRSRDNVYYMMHYHRLVNREPPKHYWRENRKYIVSPQSQWDNVPLWKTDAENRDLSDPTHPLHGAILAVVESSKQAIACIEDKLQSNQSGMAATSSKMKGAQRQEIEHMLQNTGCLFLFYREVKVEEKGPDVVEFEQKQREEQEMESKTEEESSSSKDNGKNAVTIDLSKNTSSAQNDAEKNSEIKASDHLGLSHLIKFLKRKKLICDVVELKEKDRDGEEATYHWFCKRAQDILKTPQSNKVVVLRMVETKKYMIETIKSAENNEAAMDLGDAHGLDNGTDQDSESEGDGDDQWLSFEPEHDDGGELKPVKEEDEKRVILKSDFKCFVECEFTMSTVQPHCVTATDVMQMHKEEGQWTQMENRMSAKLNEQGIWNRFDLLDRPLMDRLKSKLTKNAEKNSVGPEQRLRKHFVEFSEAIPRLLEQNKQKDDFEQLVISGVECTRNARLLQDYIAMFRRYDATSKVEEDEHKMYTEIGDTGDAEVIQSNDDHTMIVSYNPVQTVVVTQNQIKEVTHPIHIYRAAYEEKMYPEDQIAALHSEWMKCQYKDAPREKANIIQALNSLLRYNKKYEIILVPSSVALDMTGFVKAQCERVAPNHEAIADYRITFLYKGQLYRYDKQKARRYRLRKKQSDLNVKDDLLDDDEEKIFVDEIKNLLHLLRDNVLEEGVDALDPNTTAFELSTAGHVSMDTAPTMEDIARKSLSRMSFSRQSSMFRSMSYRPGDLDQLEVSMDPEDEDFNGNNQSHQPAINYNNSNEDDADSSLRLRASIKRKHTDRIYQWLHVGCGSCFLHRSNGGAIKDVSPPNGTDHETEFPKQLQKEMFLNYIDCSVPWKEDEIEMDHICQICYQLIVEPTTIGNPNCKHYFCKWCIKQWYIEPKKHSRKDQQNRQNCPMRCGPILELQPAVQMSHTMRKGIPTTIWQQAMEDKVSWYWRNHENDEFEKKREEQIDQSDNNGAYDPNNQAQQVAMAGYGLDDPELAMDI